MIEESAICVYEKMSEVKNAIKLLKDNGFPTKQISVVSRSMESKGEVHGYVTLGAEAGAWAGGIFGMLLGAAFLWIPGAGLVVIAGSLASALLGGVEGALAGALGGGLIGTLLGEKVSEEQKTQYDEMLKAGKHLVITHGNVEEVNRAFEMLKDTSNVKLSLYIEEKK